MGLPTDLDEHRFRRHGTTRRSSPSVISPRVSFISRNCEDLGVSKYSGTAYSSVGASCPGFAEQICFSEPTPPCFPCECGGFELPDRDPPRPSSACWAGLGTLGFGSPRLQRKAHFVVVGIIASTWRDHFSMRACRVGDDETIPSTSSHAPGVPCSLCLCASRIASG